MSQDANEASTAAAALPLLASVGGTTTSSSGSPRHSKLDGVLSRFYAKTVALITTERLAPFEPVSSSSSGSPLTGAESVHETQATAQQQQQPGRNGSSITSRRISKWFELNLEESDLFREELRLWRAPSSFIPTSVLHRLESGESSQFPGYVPLLFVEVILDLSRLEQHDVVRLKGVQVKESMAQGLNGICLERWKLTFDIHGAPFPPELSTVYQRSVAHFRQLEARLRVLPASALTKRLRAAASLLRIGVRLSTDESEAHAVLALDRSLQGGFADVRSEAFDAIHTAIGSLHLTVEYRAEVEFEAGQPHSLAMGLQDIEVDEDYFRPAAMARHTQQHLEAAAAATAIPKSLLSTTANKRVSALTAGRAAAVAAGVASPGSIASTASSPGPTEPQSKSPALSSSSGSVFSTSVPGNKLVAGLSSLRHNAPPLTGTSPVLTRGTSAGSSSNAAGAVAAGTGGGVGGPSEAAAAFLPQGRRMSSTGERRLRTLSSLSFERSSPPSPTAASGTSTTAAGLGLANAAVAPQSVLRASFSRPLGYSTLRSGSFSPSSPSPLAQQMNAHRSSSANVGDAATGAQPASLSSSPGFRSYMSTTPNLRSVFQSYAAAPMGSGSGYIATTAAVSRVSPRSSALGAAGEELSASTSPVSRTLATTGGAGAQPTVAPQMIKRYSSTFSYRQGRQYASTGTPGSGSGSPSAASASGSGSAGIGGGRAAAAAATTTTTTGEATPYSSSWQARLEHRQGFSSAAAFHPTSMPREEGAGAGAGAMGLASGGAAFVGSLSPRMTRRRMSNLPGGHEDEIDDLVRMIDSRVELRDNNTPPSASAVHTASTVVQPQRTGAYASSSLARTEEPSPAFVERAVTSGSEITGASASAMAGATFARRPSTASGGAFSPGRGGAAAPTLSRVQVNEMLSRMAASVNRGVGGGGAGGGEAVALGGGGAAAGAFARSPLSAPPVSVSGLSRGNATASSKASTSSTSSATTTTTTTLTSIAAPIAAGTRPVFVRPPHAHVAAYDTLDASSSSPAGSIGLVGRCTPGGESVGGSGSGGSQSASVSTSTHGRHSATAPVDATQRGAASARHRPSTGSLEMYSQSYEDEAVGRLELQETDDSAARQSTNEAELANFLQRRRPGNGNGGNGAGHSASGSDY